eukprot:scaffold647_cov411-Prasinococcus_capsulatus_cf.AAC.2
MHRLTALSYKGDIRMAFAEDKRKVRNIAGGKFALTYAEDLLGHYSKHMRLKTCNTTKPRWLQDSSADARLLRLIQLPFTIQRMPTVSEPTSATRTDENVLLSRKPSRENVPLEEAPRPLQDEWRAYPADHRNSMLALASGVPSHELARTLSSILARPNMLAKLTTSQAWTVFSSSLRHALIGTLQAGGKSFRYFGRKLRKAYESRRNES